MELKGSVAILTGASRGLGVRIAESLARRGVDLALAARSEEQLQSTARRVERYGVRALSIPTDITKTEDLESLVERTSRELGPVDVLVNNAGVECVGYFERLELDVIDRTVRTNLTSLVALTRLVVPSMIERRRGHVVNVASTAGKSSRPFGVVYAATKHGVVGFSWGLRAELDPYQVRVSVVSPHYVTGEGMFAEREATLTKIPSSLKPVTPQAVADAVVRAIERDKADVVVGPGLAKILDVVHALSPKAAIWVGKHSGLYGFLKREATGGE